MSITTMAKHLCLFMMITGALTACSGDPSKGGSSGATSSSSSGHTKPSSSSSSSSGKSSSSSSSSSGKSSSSSSSGGGICPANYKPVCSVEPQNLQCIKAPCPTGVYKTYSNQCASDLAKAKFISNGECGDLEGKPYIEELTACTAQYDPVCAAATDIAPCKTIPCPARLYKTFGNACEASVAKAGVIQKGECGTLEGTPVQMLNSTCPANAPGACAKTLSNIVCVTAPCPTHVYKTLSNSCVATMTMNTVVSEGRCGSLEGVLAGGEPPVKLVDSLPTASAAKVGNVQFKGDVVTLTLGYSGCGPQHFDFYIGKGFLKSKPVQVNFAFKAQREELCEAYFTTEFSYDLLPLKQLYGAEHGDISLPGIGLYVF